jgi:hypothetical protein
MAFTKIKNMSVGSVFQIGKGRKYYIITRFVEQQFWTGKSYEWKPMVEYKQQYSNNPELYYVFPDFEVKRV